MTHDVWQNGRFYDLDLWKAFDSVLYRNVPSIFNFNFFNIIFSKTWILEMNFLISTQHSNWYGKFYGFLVFFCVFPHYLGEMTWSRIVLRHLWSNPEWYHYDHDDHDFFLFFLVIFDHIHIQLVIYSRFTRDSSALGTPL